MTKRKLKQKQKPAPVEDAKPKLRSGSHNKQQQVVKPPEPPPKEDEPENGWICSRCSTENSLDDIECIACGGHRKRTTRKRPTMIPEPLHEDKIHVFKESRRSIETNDDKSAMVK